MTDVSDIRIVKPEQFVSSPWKNGGGVTHEIARADRGGQLLWRLSIAEVDREGPFSVFAGLQRILTVISGAGMNLQGARETLEAAPMSPLPFSGDLALNGTLIDGPVRNFNLIFDPSRLCPRVTCHRAPKRLCFPDHSAGVFMVSGQAEIGGVEVSQGSFAIGQAFDAELAPNSAAICVELRPVVSTAY